MYSNISSRCCFALLFLDDGLHGRMTREKKSNPASTRAAFDSSYFRKYYFRAATRVTSAAEMRGRAQLIAAILRHAGIPVRSILDAGCGIGLLRKPFAETLPRARYKGLETSDYLCTRYAWTPGSVVDF